MEPLGPFRGGRGLRRSNSTWVGFQVVSRAMSAMPKGVVEMPMSVDRNEGVRGQPTGQTDWVTWRPVSNASRLPELRKKKCI